MILVIDVGNTRLKWAWLDSAGLSSQQAVVHRGAKPDLWTTALFRSARRADRVLVANVAGDRIAKTLERGAKRAFGVTPEFLTSTSEFQDLKNGYLDPSLLGVDRWLGIIGAWTTARTAVCVVDAGTAVKVDLVDAGGQHLGGLIVPGIQMMREALLQRTSNIARAAEQSTPSLAGVLANNTIGAISRGAVFAVAGLTDLVADVVAQNAGIKPKLFITGGDAGLITGTMRLQAAIVPDLVLQGLAAVAAQPRT